MSELVLCISKGTRKSSSYHVLEFSLGGVQIQGTHNSAKLLCSDGTIAIFIKKAVYTMNILRDISSGCGKVTYLNASRNSVICSSVS